jgi:hypothetical protein
VNSAQKLACTSEFTIEFMEFQKLACTSELVNLAYGIHKSWPVPVNFTLVSTISRKVTVRPRPNQSIPILIHIPRMTSGGDAGSNYYLHTGILSAQLR